MPALQHIGYRSFVHCGDLTAMELPALTSIEDAVFESSALTMLRLGDTPPSTVGDKSFAGCPAPRYLQANVVDAYRSYDDGMPGDDFWYGWRIGETPNNLVVSINGNAETIAPSLLAAIDNSGLLRSNITSIDIVGGDFTAAEWVALKDYMADLTGLQRFFIGDAVTVSDMPSTSIERPYFGASLREISIPQLQVLGYYAFAKCSSLSVVSLPNLRHIYSSAFASCGMLDSLCLPRLEAIYGGFVFRNSGLARLYLGATPPTVSVGNAFSECSFPRYLYIVDDNGAEISGEALNAAQQAYRLTSGYDAAVEQWYGFNLDGAPLMQIMVNATMHRTGHTLAEALQGLDFGAIQSIEVTGGEFLVANWHYLRQQRNNLNQLSTFIISNGVSTVADMPALEISDGGYFASSLQRFEAHGLKNIGNYAFRSSQLATLKLPQASLLYNQAFYANNNLCMMQLGAKPPMLKYGVFYGYSSSQPRLLQLVDAQGEPLTRGELQTAREAYRADNDGNTSDNIWNGWILANTLTVKTSVTGSGIVALPFSIVLSDTLTNRQVLLQVTPNGGNRLKRISAHKADDASVLVPIDATSMSFVMPQHDVIVEAEFEAIMYTVEGLVNPAEGGSITGTGTYEEGATATLTVTANAGYRFVRWSIAGSEVSTSNTYSFTVTGDASLTAEFEAIVTPNTYTVSATANPAEGGTITGAGTYEEGATATLAATANAGYRFVRWTANGLELGANATLSITVTSDSTLVAEFEVDNTTPCTPSYSEFSATATNSYEWNGTTYTESGDYTLTLQTAEGCDSTITLHLTILNSSTTGLNGAHVPSLSVYPNPTSGLLYIDGASFEKVLVYSVSGSLVQRCTTDAHGRVCIDLSILPIGIYFVRSGNAVARVVRL